MQDASLLSLAAELADAAGRVILEIRARGFATERKADSSPVTEADRQAEALILAGLRRRTPEIPVIAEEEVSAGHSGAPAAAFWLVDPLDGTREFAAGRDDFAVNIGLVRDGRAVLGVVGLPAYGELFGGIVGAGAWKRDGAGQRPVRARRPDPAGVEVLTSRHYADDPRLAAFLGGRRVAAVRPIGSAVKFCRLAEGLGDLYPRFGRTMEWDTAAPQAVLEAAGGAVWLLPAPDRPQPGAVLRYGKPGWENPPFVCTGLAGAAAADAAPRPPMLDPDGSAVTRRAAPAAAIPPGAASADAGHRAPTAEPSPRTADRAGDVAPPARTGRRAGE